MICKREKVRYLKEKWKYILWRYYGYVWFSYFLVCSFVKKNFGKYLENIEVIINIKN